MPSGVNLTIIHDKSPFIVVSNKCAEIESLLISGNTPLYIEVDKTSSIFNNNSFLLS